MNAPEYLQHLAEPGDRVTRSTARGVRIVGWTNDPIDAVAVIIVGAAGEVAFRGTRLSTATAFS